MPSIFNTSKLLIAALMLLTLNLLCTSCSRSKGSNDNSDLYNSIEAEEGGVYTVLIGEEIGTSTLYTNCTSTVKTVLGRSDFENTTVSTSCPTERPVYAYEGLITTERNGQVIYLPQTFYSYEQQNLTGPTRQVNGKTYYLFSSQATKDLSVYSHYVGLPGFVFILDVEQPHEEQQHANTPDETLSNPEPITRKGPRKECPQP